MSTIRSRDDWRGVRAPSVFAPAPPIFNPPAEAPLDTDVQVQVRDGAGTYVLPFKCRRTHAGWINHHGSLLGVTVTGWRHGGWTTKSRARG